MNEPKVSLDQWLVLQAVAEEGGFQAAADRLRRSQSSVSYAVHQLQDKLGVVLFEYRGRKAHLTEYGQLIMNRGRVLVDQARHLESVAADMARGWEPQVSLLADAIVPREPLYDALEQFRGELPGTQVEFYTETLSGSHELILAGAVDVALVGIPPVGFLGQPLLPVQMIAVASPSHPLAAASSIEERDLREHLQLVVRDSGSHRRIDAGWLGASQRWTVASFDESLALISRGLGFAFLPLHKVESALAEGTVVRLPVGFARRVQASLVFPDRDDAGPAARRLGELLQAACAQFESAARG